VSLLYHYPCPKCSRPTELSLTGVCLNRGKDGSVCGYELPKDLRDFNNGVRDKIEKHTQEPVGTFPGQISYNPFTGFYVQNLNEARAVGNIYLDLKNGYFCTYITPSGDSAIATLCSGNASNQFIVSGYKMPLNSKIQNLHGHYDNLDSGMLFVATPVNTVVEYPSAKHPNEFQVLQNGEVIAAWNIAALSGFVGSHITIK
jgi:hypothetical protein